MTEMRDGFPGNLRDWFAGQAMSRFSEADGDAVELGKEEVAQECYAFADAMLAARGPAQAASPAPVGAEREAVERLIEAGDRMRTFLPDGNDKAAWLPKQNWKRSLAALRAIQGARDGE